MFDKLTEKLQAAFKKISGRGKLNAAAVDEGLREIRLALLDADVNFRVVKDFIDRIREKAVGEEILASLTPGQQLVKVVRDELIDVLGGTTVEPSIAKGKLNEVMLVGLQGSGKTSMCAKIGLMYKKQGFKPLLVALDVYRPAAIQQLHVVGDQAGLEVFSIEGTQDVEHIMREGHKRALEHASDLIIYDTAGRTHIDDDMMDEVRRLKKMLPAGAEVLLVIDSMTGQDAVNIATNFNNAVGITGAVLTKLDGDARGGAAISVRHITGVPIIFAGVGETLQGIEVFHPDRMAGRILGMGDVLSLVEKVEQEIEEDDVLEMQQRLLEKKYNFEDFYNQFQQIKKLGPLQSLVGMVPGMGGVAKQLDQVDPKKFAHLEAMILSMTLDERRNPEILNRSRKERIAKGAGVQVNEVSALVKQFDQAKVMIERMTGGNMRFKRPAGGIKALKKRRKKDKGSRRRRK